MVNSFRQASFRTAKRVKASINTVEHTWYMPICPEIEATFSSFFLSSGGWGKIKLKLTTLLRIFIRVVCRFNSFGHSR